MDTVARMTPSDFAYIIGAAALVMITQMLWGWREPIIDYVTLMRRRMTSATATQPVAATDNEPLRPIAIGRNERNEELSRNERNEELRRMQADIIMRLISSDALFIADGKGGYKKAGQGVLIKVATGLEPNGRKESDYGLLQAELKGQLNPTLTIHAGRPDEYEITK